MKMFIFRRPEPSKPFAINIEEIVMVVENTDKKSRENYAFIVRFRGQTPEMLLSESLGLKLLAMLECESDTKLKSVFSETDYGPNEK